MIIVFVGGLTVIHRRSIWLASDAWQTWASIGVIVAKTSVHLLSGRCWVTHYIRKHAGSVIFTTDFAKDGGWPHSFLPCLFIISLLLLQSHLRIINTIWYPFLKYLNCVQFFLLGHLKLIDQLHFFILKRCQFTLPLFHILFSFLQFLGILFLCLLISLLFFPFID